MRLVLTMTLLLTACQPAPADDESPPQPTAPSLQSVAPPVAETDATVSPHLWGMNDVGDALMYAPRESDDIHISLRCAPDGKIRIRAFNPAHGGKRLYLASGSESETFSARSIPGDGELLAVDEYSSEIIISADNHVLAAFRTSGAMEKGEPVETMNAKTPEELAEIQSFFANCKV